MQTNKSLIFDIVVPIFIIIIIRNNITEALSISEYLNFKSNENIATANNITSGNNYSSDDPYIDEVYEECITAEDISTCAKFRILKYFHEMIPPFEEKGNNSTAINPEFPLWGPMKLIPLSPADAARNDGVLFPGLKPDSTDSEFMKLFRFTLREVERFLKSYGLLIDFSGPGPSEGGEDDLESPRFMDDFFGGNLSGGARREKKKNMMFLLPLLSFLYLKTLLVPILLAVLFIKKILVLAVIFLPSLLSLVKLCRPFRHHPTWIAEHEHDVDHQSEFSPYFHDFHKTVAAEDLTPVSEGWTTSTHYPDLAKSSWDILQPEGEWGYSNLGPLDAESPTEVTTRYKLDVDDIRGARRRLSYRPREQGDHRRLHDVMKWVETRSHNEDGSRDIYYGPVTGDTWDSDSPPRYHYIKSNQNGIFLGRSLGTDQLDEADPKWGKQHNSVSSQEN